LNMRSNRALKEGETTNENPAQKKSFLGSISDNIGKIFSFPKKYGLQESIEEVLDEKGAEATSPLDAGEKAILKNVLEFKELHVEDVMIPRADIFAVHEGIEFEELQHKLIDKTYTRIPVYKSDLDEILGFIHIKDLARTYFNKQNFDIKQILRKSLFVPPSMKVSNLLIRMQQSRVHIAIVIDEYGGTEGIVTLEDIVEQIVGNIEDEHDEDESSNSLKKISDDIFEVSSRIRIQEFLSKSSIDLSVKDASDQFDTVGGLVTYLLGRIPVKGEIITFNEQIELEITDADARAVRRLVVKKKN
jgi:magnesium and cobalt transporter